MGYLGLRNDFLEMAEKRFSDNVELFGRVREIVLNDDVIEDFEGREFAQKLEDIVKRVKGGFLGLEGEVGLESEQVGWLIDKYFMLVYARYLLDCEIEKGGVTKEERRLARKERLMMNYMRNTARGVLYGEGSNGE